MKKILAFAMLLVLATSVCAVEVPKDCRVANIPPGYCCWASLETLGRTNGIKELENLLENRTKEQDNVVIVPGYGGVSYKMVEPKNYGYDHSLKNKLKELKVKFWMENTGNTDRTLLKYANSLGCVVGLKAGARGEGAHGIVLTHYDDKIIRFYDPNQPNDLWEGTRDWFDHYWSGMVIVVEK